MKILFIGDIFGRSGREALQKHLPTLKETHNPDIIIVNGENAANGAGITEKICKEFYDWGVDVITTGNHVWDQREILSYIQRDKNLLRPHNYPQGTPGSGIVTHQIATGEKITIINMMARVFMDSLDDPFQCMENILKDYKLGQNTNAIFVDLHGETTSEKMAFGHHFSGRISALIGTHTHIPTADAHIMQGGTAYQTDAGMTGPFNSVIGVEKEIAIHKFVKKLPGEKFRPAKGEATLCGVIIQTQPNGLAKSISPIKMGGILGD